MPDLGAISVGLQSIKTAIEIAKEFRGIDASLKDAEVKLKITELLEALSDAKLRLLEARDDNIELREKVKSLEEELNQKGEVEFRDGYYFTIKPQPGKPEGPFCSKCYSDENKLILLEELSGPFTTFGKFSCPKCKGTFG